MTGLLPGTAYPVFLRLENEGWVSGRWGGDRPARRETSPSPLLPAYPGRCYQVQLSPGQCQAAQPHGAPTTGRGTDASGYADTALRFLGPYRRRHQKFRAARLAVPAAVIFLTQIISSPAADDLIISITAFTVLILGHTKRVWFRWSERRDAMKRAHLLIPTGQPPDGAPCA